MVHEDDRLLEVGEVAQEIGDGLGQDPVHEEFVHQKTHFRRLQQLVLDRVDHLLNGILFVKENGRGLGWHGQIVIVLVNKGAVIGNADPCFGEIGNNNFPRGFHLGIADHDLVPVSVNVVAV